MSYEFRMSRSTVCHVLLEVCDAIWKVLHPEYLKMPTSKTEWLSISKYFEELWNFPNCVGAIDGKHVVIQAPKNAGSSFFNYKCTHSVVLLAVCDAHYRFVMVDVGGAGWQSGGGVLSNSLFGREFENGSLSLPDNRSLPGLPCSSLPYVFLGDEAFPLKQNMMRPYPGRNLPQAQAIYNRLSHAKRIIENTFGILASRWRIFQRPIIATPDRVVAFTKAAIALLNFLQVTESPMYCPSLMWKTKMGTLLKGHGEMNQQQMDLLLLAK